MSSISFSIAPDIAPQRLPGWYILATWLQKQLDISIKTTDYISFEAQKEALLAGEIDLLYANPYDAGWLVREQKFHAIAQPYANVAEVTIVSMKEGPIAKVVDVPKGAKVAAAMNADLRTLGAILLEPANLTKEDFSFLDTANHILAVKQLLNGSADIAMLPTNIYKGLSNMIGSQLVPLVATMPYDIETVAHCFVLSPEHFELEDRLKEAFRNMHDNHSGQIILEDIGVSEWKVLESKEEIVFMIDLIYALQV